MRSAWAESSCGLFRVRPTQYEGREFSRLYLHLSEFYVAKSISQCVKIARVVAGDKLRIAKGDCQSLT